MNITLLKRALNQALSLGNTVFNPQFASFLPFSTFEIANRRRNDRNELPLIRVYRRPDFARTGRAGRRRYAMVRPGSRLRTAEALSRDVVPRPRE